MLLEDNNLLCLSAQAAVQQLLCQVAAPAVSSVYASDIATLPCECWQAAISSIWLQLVGLLTNSWFLVADGSVPRAVQGG